MRIALFAAAVAGLSACVSDGAPTARSVHATAGFTRDAYCALTPEARAELRRMAGIRVPLLACPNDRVRRSRRGRDDGAAGQD